MQLDSLIEGNFRLIEPQKKALKKLGIKTVEDLLYHFPVRYGDTSEKRNIGTLIEGEKAVIFGKISGLKISKGFKSKIPMSEAWIEDESGTIKAVWFHQPYIAKMIHEGAYVRADGKVSNRKGELYLSNPKIETIVKLPVGVGDSLFGLPAQAGERDTEHSLYPVYPESRGVTSNWLYYTIQKIFSTGILNDLPDPIPEYILSTYNLPSLKTALIWIHAPQKQDDAISARKRFAFEEVFFIQLQKKREKIIWNKNPSYVIEKTPKDIEQFVKTFPFQATDAQNKAIEQIMTDFRSGHAMARLLEGDVGSGKTAVAATTAYSIVTSKPKGQTFGNLQVAYMAPTEILAKQHFDSFIEYFTYLRINIGLITGKECRKFPSKTNPKQWTKISKPQLLKWVANGEIPILIGTHALIQKNVKFKHLAYSIVDEQHRFGVSQRYAMARGQNRGLDADLTQTQENKSDLLYEDITYKIRESVLNVKKELGLGHKEIIYQKALREEFIKNKINFSQEHRISIKYNGKNIGTYVPDFLIDNKIILELKALPFVGSVETKQVWNYLKGSDFKLALLVNFGMKTVDIKRIIYDEARSLVKKVSVKSASEESASCPHLLSMTATPIPRTLALTIYGDLDLTLLDQMPVGRKPILTEIVLPNERENTYAKIKIALAEGRQLYVICPRIEVPDPAKESAIIAKSVKEEAERLKKDIFQDYEIGILHSKMLQGEKEEVMNNFKEGKIQILVATSVVEVGVNVPNATVIIIEGAERFGLAQLHQLRGRVIRSNHQAYCYVFAESKTDKTLQRLKAFKNSSNGFELAEFDLKLRGPGELSGNKQWGISDIGMEAIRNLKMVEAARAEAEYLLSQDEMLTKFPLINKKLSHRKEEEIHFE